VRHRWLGELRGRCQCAFRNPITAITRQSPQASGSALWRAGYVRSSIINRFEEAMMVSATRQIARGQRDSSAITESAQAEVRPLGSLEHLFWLLDQHHFVHFAVTALISGGTSPAIGGEHLIASKNGIQSSRSASMESQIRSPRFVRRTPNRFRCGLWRMNLSCAGKPKLERNWRRLSTQVEHRSFAPF